MTKLLTRLLALKIKYSEDNVRQAEKINIASNLIGKIIVESAKRYTADKKKMVMETTVPVKTSTSLGFFILNNVN
ncbi:MAG: hypothetical protein QXX02_02765, partial [Candidatus Bathyarchaeia archaeon]